MKGEVSRLHLVNFLLALSDAFSVDHEWQVIPIDVVIMEQSFPWLFAGSTSPAGLNCYSLGELLTSFWFSWPC